jgi:hypothetical protein
MDDLFRLFIKIVSIITVGAWIVGFIRYKYLSVALRFVFLHLTLAVITEITTKVMGVWKLNNLPVLHIYTPLEYTLIGWFYLEVLKNYIPSKWINGSIVVFLIFSLINSLLIQDMWSFNTNSRSLEAVMIIVLSLISFHRILTELKVKRLDIYPEFWINTGYLLYFSGAFFLFIMSNFILDRGKTLNLMMWTVHAGLSSMLYLLLGIGLWMHRKT